MANGAFNITSGNFAVQTGRSLTINSDSSLAGGSTLAVANTASLVFGTASTTTGSGTFQMSSGATLTLISPGGLDGHFPSCAFNLNTGAKYIYAGTSEQVTGPALTSTVGTDWDEFAASSSDTTNNTVTVTGIPGFSNWTLGTPGSLPVSLSSVQIE